MSEWRIEALGDGAVLIRLGDTIDAALNARCVSLAAALHALALPGVLDIAPAYASVCLRYEPAAWAGASQLPHDAIAARLRTCLDDALPLQPRSGAAPLEIPVCYGGEFGVDLDYVAAQTKLRAQQVVERHCAVEYSVAMLGFAPGFPYLLGLDPALHTARRAEPRTRVPAGSVAIGGAQTGIYPRELPGGWHLIGRTPLRLFDSTRAAPALLIPGQRVRFRAIDAAQFARDAA